MRITKSSSNWCSSVSGLVSAAALCSAIFPQEILCAADNATPGTSEYVERLGRANKGFTELRAEQSRLLDREKTLRQTIAGAEAQIQGFQQRIVQISNQIGLIQIQIANLQQQSSGGGTGKSSRPTLNSATANQLQSLQNSAAALNSQVAPLQGAIAQEQIRIRSLNVDLEKNAAVLNKLLTSGRTLLNDFYKLADHFGRYDRDALSAAVVELSTFIVADAENMGATLVRGVAHRQLGDRAAAELDFSRVAQEEGPLQAEAFIIRGHLRAATGREKESKKDIAEATKLTAKQSDAHVAVYRGLLFCHEGKFTSAETELKKALRLSGNDADIHRLLALVQISLPKTPVLAKAALDNAQRACELTKSKDWLCLEALAAAHAFNDNFESAYSAAESASKFATSDHREICERMAQLYQDKKPVELDWLRLARMEGAKQKRK